MDANRGSQNLYRGGRAEGAPYTTPTSCTNTLRSSPSLGPAAWPELGGSRCASPASSALPLHCLSLCVLPRISLYCLHNQEEQVSRALGRLHCCIVRGRRRLTPLPGLCLSSRDVCVSSAIYKCVSLYNRGHVALPVWRDRVTHCYVLAFWPLHFPVVSLCHAPLLASPQKETTRARFIFLGASEWTKILLFYTGQVV